MISHRLQYFTQDEVDNAVTEALFKDRRGGGKNPYIIGDMVCYPDGTPVLWENYRLGVSHRLCIEHAPDEYVDYEIVEGMLDAQHLLQLTQLPNGYYGDIKRIGFIPLKVFSGSGSMADSTQVVSRVDGNVEELANYYFGLHDKDLSKLTFVPDESDTQPMYCEIDATSSACPYYTTKVRYTDMNFNVSGDCVLYCVYKHHDGIFDIHRYHEDSTYKHYKLPVLISIGKLTNVCLTFWNDTTQQSIEVAIQRRYEHNVWQNLGDITIPYTHYDVTTNDSYNINVNSYNNPFFRYGYWCVLQQKIKTNLTEQVVGYIKFSPS